MKCWKVKKWYAIPVSYTHLDGYKRQELYIEVSIEYGANMMETLRILKKETRREIENLTAMYISSVDIVAKQIHFPEEEW